MRIKYLEVSFQYFKDNFITIYREIVNVVNGNLGLDNTQFEIKKQLVLSNKVIIKTQNAKAVSFLRFIKDNKNSSNLKYLGYDLQKDSIIIHIGDFIVGYEIEILIFR